MTRRRKSQAPPVPEWVLEEGRRLLEKFRGEPTDDEKRLAELRKDDHIWEARYAWYRPRHSRSDVPKRPPS